MLAKTFLFLIKAKDKIDIRVAMKVTLANIVNILNPIRHIRKTHRDLLNLSL